MESYAVWNQKQNRRQVLAVFEEAIRNRSHRYFSLSFACFWVWFWAVSRSSIFFPHVIVGIAPWLRLLPVAAGAVTFLVLGLRFRRKPFLTGTKRSVLLAYTCMSVGCAFCALSSQEWLSLDLTLLFYVTGSAVTGIAAAFVLLEFARILGVLGSQRALVQIVLSTLGSMILSALLAFMPLTLAGTFAVALPFLGLFALVQAGKGLAVPQILKHGFGQELHLPWKLLLTLFAQGVAVEVFRNSLVRGSSINADSLNALCTILAVVAIALSSFFFKLNYNNLIYHVGFVVMALGFLLIACLPGNVLPGAVLILAGGRYVSFLTWSLFAYFIKNKGLPAVWVLAWPTSSLLFGMCVGGLTSDVLFRGNLSDHMATLATVAVFSLLLVALFMLSSRNLCTGWGMVHPGASESSPSPLADARQQLAEYYDLTNREGEILSHIAHGRNSSHIAEELGISYTTVKTHVRNIYEKAGVHSRLELMRLIEHEVAALQGE